MRSWIEASTCTPTNSSLCTFRQLIARRISVRPLIASMMPSDTSSMDELECQLVRIWEDVFGKQGIGIRDSFWDLGGHSFIALRMARCIERLLSKSLPIATLLQTSTIEEL